VSFGATLGALVDSRVQELFERLVRELGAPDPDPWVPHTRWPWPRRKARELAAAGAIPGARKVGKDWMVRRSVLDAFIEGHPVASAPSPAPTAAETDDVDEVLQRRGFRRAGR
jgi:Helix-turn-helix domain